jgi:hypothetical protein
MRKMAVGAGLFFLLLLGSALTAQAGARHSFGFSVGVGPVIPYGYYYPRAYPAYRPHYFTYPSYDYYYPPYQTYAVLRYFGGIRNRPYGARHYPDRRDNRRLSGGRDRPNPRSRSSRERHAWR